MKKDIILDLLKSMLRLKCMTIVILVIQTKVEVLNKRFHLPSYKIFIPDVTNAIRKPPVKQQIRICF